MRAVASLARRSVRAGSGRFLAEGPQVVRELLRYAAPTVVDLYLTQDAENRHTEILAAAARANCSVHRVSDQVLAAMSDAQTPQGMVAVARWSQTPLEQVLVTRPQLLVLLVEVRDPGNLGTVIRGADAAGADAVLVTEDSVDVLSPKVVRATAGSLFHVPVVTGLDAEATLTTMRENGIRTLATQGSATTSLPDLDLRSAHAWVMGTEAAGLPPALAARCAQQVSIPIHGKAESLNLAMAATICLYASAAQHHGAAAHPRSD